MYIHQVYMYMCSLKYIQRSYYTRFSKASVYKHSLYKAFKKKTVEKYHRFEFGKKQILHARI